MITLRSRTLVSALALAALALLAVAPASAAHTGPLVTPSLHAGNFTAVDDLAICEAILGEDATQEMVGFKVDPPTGYADGFVTFTLSPDGKLLAWSVGANTTMLAVVVKGGPNYHLYDYYAANLDADHDTGLVSPLNKRNTPQISHYNVCYQREPGGAGCTPGYWRNHADRWLGAAPGDDFDSTFGVDLFDPDVTLGWAIWAQGGGLNALARHATAALLNSYGGVPNGDGTVVEYPFSTAQVIDMVQQAEDQGMIEFYKDIFEAANELGCPLAGTKADPVN
jgi:hypothetical protein